MKLTHVFAAALLLFSGAASAQTDVTSTYLTNPSFELSAAGTNTSAQALSNGGSYYGWTLPSLGTQYVNISIGDASTCNGQAFGIPTATEGSFYYFCRRGWNSSTSADATLSTTLANLPVGHYTLTMDYKGLDSWDNSHTSRGSYMKVEAVETTTLASQQTATFDAVNGNNAGSGRFTGSSNWKSVTLEFDVATAGDVALNIVHHFVGGVRTDAVIDNLRLTWTDPEAAAKAAQLEAAKYTLNGYIKKATALNAVLADATLASAIETAQGVYDAADSYAEDYDNTVNASATLNTAITTALSGATAVTLVNGNFDTTPNNTLDGDNTVFRGTLSTATSNPDNTKDFSANTGDHAYLYEVTGWTQYSKFNSTASQGTTSEYGTAMPANGWSTNSTTPPATDMFGGTTGAALHLSAGWGDQARYQQTIESLPAGRYVLYYEVINQHNNTGIASNYIGVNGAAGDFYGTSNSFVYSSLSSIEQGVWKAQAFAFDVAKTADVNFSVGVTTSINGSGNGAKLWVDNVLVYRIGDVVVTDADATAILAEVAALDQAVYNAAAKSALATAKSAFESNKSIDNYNALNAALIAANASVTAYTALNAAITKVEGWTATTAAAGIRAKYTNGEYADETAADIYAEYQAAEIAALKAASSADFSSVILNRSFETGDMTGWSAESRNDTGVKANSNATYTTSDVDGDYLFNSWGGSAENNVYQTIPALPAGTYQLSALLAGFNGEELVLTANETTNSVFVSGDKTVGNTVSVIFTLAEDGDVTIKASNTKGQSTSDASFIKADNFRLVAYSDPLAAYKEQLDAKKAEASEALAAEDYVNVTGDEKTDLQTKADVTPEETAAAYQTAIDELTAAISAFKAAKTGYDALVAANTAVAAVPELVYADAAKKPAAATATTAEEASTKAAAQTTAIRAYYESHALAEGVEDAVNMTSLLAAANADTNTGWTNGIGTNQGQGYTDAAGTVAAKYLDGGWAANAGANIDMTRSVEIPAGKYLLTVKARGAVNLDVYTLSIAGETIDLPHANGNSNGVFGNGWEDASIEFETQESGRQTLEIKATSTASQQWISLNDFRLIRLELYTEMADDDDYAALNDAIAAAEAKTLGFDEGEYAPYNNVEVLKAIATAKAIDQNVENAKDDVTALTETLTNGWTANAAEMDAIFDGQFATTEANTTSGDINLPGWTKVQGIRLLVKDETVDPGLAYTDGKAAVFSWGGTTLTYGEQTGYTLPLNQHSIYELTFKASAWRDGAFPSWVSVELDGVAQSEATSVPGKINDAEGNPFRTYTYYLEPTADNSVLKIYMNQHFTLADLSMKLAVAEELILDEADSYTPAETYADITLKRDIKEGYNTIVLPFSLTAEQVADVFGQSAVVYEYSETVEGESVTINFNSKRENTIAANVPYLIGGATAASEKTISGVITSAAGAGTVAGTYFDFTGVYAPGYVGEGNYFVGNGALYKATAATTIQAFRAYIKAKAEVAEGSVKLFIDGLPTSISAINGAAAAEQGAIFNLAGQRVQKAQKGLYIVGGKKVLVK